MTHHEHSRQIDEQTLARIFNSPEARRWSSWDDACDWIERHRNEFCCPEKAREFMDSCERARHDHEPFSRDVKQAMGVMEKHHSPV